MSVKTIRPSSQPSNHFPWEELLFAAVIGLPSAAIALLIGLGVASDLGGGTYDTLIINDTVVSGGGSPFTIAAFFVATVFGGLAIFAGVGLEKRYGDWRIQSNDRSVQKQLLGPLAR
jgi:hypothetical protein